MAKKILRNVLISNQREHSIYTFTLTAADLIRLCKVERFGIDEGGVNRLLNQDHVLEIAEVMADPESLWLEPIIGDLRGDWKYEDGMLTYNDDGAYISVDDGQHRVFALQSELLTERERSRLEFTVNATQGLDYEHRLKIFRMQKERRPIDPRLDLAQRQVLGSWKSDVDKEAYQVVLELANNPESPLRGRVQLNETDSRPYEHGSSMENGLNARGLFASARTLSGRRSPLYVFPVAKRAEIVMDTIRLASQVWSSHWDKKASMLSTARGINALLQLYIVGVNFRAQVGTTFTPDSIRSGLELGSSFNWSSAAAKNQGVREIVNRLDQSIGRGQQAALKRSGSTGK